MPVKSAKQWRMMGAARSGNLKSAGGPSPSVAKEFMEKTPESKRRKFASALKKKGKPQHSGMKKLIMEM